MGNSQSGHILLKLDRTNLSYLTNEIIRGTVCLTVNEGELKVDEISICLTGEIGYIKTKLIVNGTGQSITTNDFKHKQFYSNKISLIQRKTGENKLILTKGEYSWSFEIGLVNSLPPTLNQIDLYPHIIYRLQVLIDKCWYKPNTSQITYLTINPIVVIHQQNQFKTIFESTNRKDVHLECIIDKLNYIPNECVNIQINLTNPNKNLIKQINISFYQFYQIQSNSKENLLYQTILPNLFNEKDEQIHRTFSLLIPSNSIPPTFQYENDRISVKIHYYLRMSVEVEGLFTNFHIDIPIIVLNKS